MQLRMASSNSANEPNLRVGSPLPRPTSQDPKWKAALDFESMFLGQLMKGMRQSLPVDQGEGMSQERQMFTEMLDQQYASLSSHSPAHQDLHAPDHAKAGTLKSLAAQIYRSMIRHDGGSTTATAQATAPGAGDMQGAAKARKAYPLPGREGLDLPMLPLPPLSKWDGSRSYSMPGLTTFTASPAASWASSQDKLDQTSLNALAEAAAKKHGLPANLIRSMIQTESAGHSQAISSAGAKGLMQLMDTTATDLGVRNSFDPAENVDGGARYLKSLITRFDGDLEKAVAGYNAGPGAVEKHGGIPPYRETQNYVRQVLQGMKQFAFLAEDAGE